MTGAGDDPGDFDFDLPFRLAVINSVEQRNLAMFAIGVRRTGTEPAPTPVLELLLAFAEEKIQRAVKEGHTLQGARALCELECVLRDLVKFGHQEFEEMLRGFEGGWRRCLQAARQRLVRDYLDLQTPEEELPRIQATIVAIIERGGWKNWREEYDLAIEEEALRRSTSAA
jgi:hypothetical protein